MAKESPMSEFYDCYAVCETHALARKIVKEDEAKGEILQSYIVGYPIEKEYSANELSARSNGMIAHNIS